MSTETTSRPMSRFAEKLSAFRAGLNKDEQDLLDEIVSNGDVEAHARQMPKAPVNAGEDVEAHAAAWPQWQGKASVEKEGEDVEAHAARWPGRIPVQSEDDDDVEAHARATPRATPRAAFKFNAARASYEISAKEDVEAHARAMPRPVEARMPAATR